jgi:RimJ/RimL family protein N-acetyltransferase
MEISRTIVGVEVNVNKGKRKMGKETRNVFEGELVRLAAWRDDDAAVLSGWSEDASYLRALDTDSARPLSVEQVVERFKSMHADPNMIEFHLRTLDEDRLVGFVALHSIEWNNQVAMLAIGIGRATDRNRGYGRDALNLGLRYAFDELNLHRVGLNVIADNTPAIHLYEKAGFKREGIIRDAVLRDGRRCDCLLMGILGREWRGKT